ncbi:hypothetical protein DPMN_168920 [Dreissena polymorpha]|uniref:FUZ/MON1/HPS1 second Longin domain-containing protein n=1 Tax=Dreissena polymorpha TaxID=45954 RepID=A0A9D4J037_DREPO|nr:hypothetical protein DPMN_168920 [Dreissena polymorpha]
MPIFSKFRIGRPRFIEKSERWHYLRIMMSTWSFLAKNEQAFLCGFQHYILVEKLHMNQMVSEMCVDVLRRIVTRMQEAGETRTQHALLLINSKLLSLYSNQNASELQASDVLCIIIIVRSLFPTHDRLEDLFAQSYRPIDGQTLGVDARSPAAVRLGRTQRERFVSAAEGFNTGEETENEQYYSAMEGKSKEEMEDQGKKESVLSLDRLLLEDSDSGASTPYPEVSDIYLTPTTCPAIMHDRMGMSARPGSGSGWSAQGSSPAPSPEAGTGLFRPRSHTAGEVEGHSLESKATGGTQMGNVKSSSFGELKKKGLSCSQRCLSESRLCEDVVKQEVDVPIMPEDTDYVKQTVFLATSQCRWSPCQIHCRRLYPGIILVVLTEVCSACVAGPPVRSTGPPPSVAGPPVRSTGPPPSVAGPPVRSTGPPPSVAGPPV